MDWIQFFGFILTVGGLFLWSRTEANADRRELRSSIDALRDSTQSQIAITHSLIIEMKDEMKDFHSRLLVLEDRYLRIREKEQKEPKKKNGE